MSTNEYRSYADKFLVHNEAEKQMKEARKQFVNLIRRTGTALRKFIPDDPANRQSISAITTHVHSTLEYPTLMHVNIQCGKAGKIDYHDISVVEDYLRNNGWSIRDSFHINENHLNLHRYAIYCT